jgi:HK97 gp10 family phage protein
VIDTIEIQGLDQLSANLQALAPELKKKALVDALKAGAEVIATAMEEEAPRSSEDEDHLADNIAIQVEKNPIGSAAEVYVGPNKKIAWRARFVEFGTAAHAIVAKRAKALADKSRDKFFGRKVKHPITNPKPFMRIALQSSEGDALEAIQTSLAASLEQAAKNISRKNNGA